MKRIRTSCVAVAGLAGVAVVALASPARAADGTWLVQVAGCKVYEQVQLKGSYQHDYMRWYTPGGSKGCQAWVYAVRHRGPLSGRHLIGTSGPSQGAWYYDGPGHILKVCAANRAGAQACGPDN